ncbi:hypothetical protein COT72_05430 [archaeon CG10_big_fil_rev_8_21_14_0_10_43_11]|nr:MAG: hypothetical protein COT72_05430 [archaeon CG10_big_fil_rev_8_21_14_0_10_43_11]
MAEKKEKKLEHKKKLQDTWWRKYTSKHVDDDLEELEGELEEDFGSFPKIQRKFERAIAPLFNDFFDTGFFNTMRMPRLKMEDGLFRKPLAQVEETDKHVIVRVELPGMQKEDISITVEGRALIIDASAGSEKQEEHLYAKKYRGFRSVIKLPADVEKKASKANYEDGILTVKLQKKGPAQKDSGNITIE